MIFWVTAGIQPLRQKRTVSTSLLTMSKTENLISKDQLNKKLRNITPKDNTPPGLKTINLKKISKKRPHVYMEVQLTITLIEMM